MSKLWKVDLHAHTWFSRDCLTDPQAIIAACRLRGIDKIAITEHNNLSGARFLKQIAPELVIVGEEIKTTRGEFIAYFVKEEVPKGLTPEETLTRLRQQGAVISIPHPFDSLRRSALREPAVQEYVEFVDAIEVFNARCVFREDNEAAQQLAIRHGKLITAGSDAHTAKEVGNAYVLMPPFDDTPNSFLNSLSSAQFFGEPTSVWPHLASAYAKWSKQLTFYNSRKQ